MKAVSQILYESDTDSLCILCCSTLSVRIKHFCQNVLNLVSFIYIYLFFTLKGSSLFSVNSGSAGCFRI